MDKAHLAFDVIKLVPYKSIAKWGAIAGAGAISLLYLRKTTHDPSHFWVHFLKEDEQLLVEKLTSRYTIEGPSTAFVGPLTHATRRHGITLEPTQYVTIKNVTTGEKKVIKGPALYFLKVGEEQEGIKQGYNLTPNQFIRLQDVETGNIKIKKGPMLYFPTEKEKVLEVSSGYNLTAVEYLQVRNIQTGEVRNEVGPQLFFPSESDEVMQKKTAVTLKRTQYIYIIDSLTGTTRVEKGEKIVFLKPTEQSSEVKEAVNIDEDHAVLIRNTKTGQVSLITQHQVFFPTSDERIEDIRTRIRLDDYQVVIIKDEFGKFLFKRGGEKDSSFFLQPYWELVSVLWSTGIYKDKKALRITHFDTRPQFTWFDFEIRTKDNVELILGLTFFWQIVDVEKMIHVTGDAVGDLCSHSRSIVIQSASRVNLEAFLGNFNEFVTKAIMNPEDTFSEKRGYIVHGIEVRSVTCKDANTQKILLEIIQETTNRISRLQKQDSENETRIKKIEGEIAAEKMNQELSALRQKLRQAEALSAGQAEALRVKSFMDGIQDIPDRSEIYNLLRKKEILTELSKGRANLYFTPNDVNLSIQSKVPPE